jgi:hypothetical protein
LKSDLVHETDLVREEVLDRGNQATDVDFRAELFPELAAQGFGARPAVLDGAAEQPKRTSRP